MVESKFVVLQMIPHTLFIEWDFRYYSRHCSLAVLLFMTLFTSRFTVHDTVTGRFTVHDTVTSRFTVH